MQALHIARSCVLADLDPDQLDPPRRPTLDGHRRLATLKLLGDQSDKLVIRFAFDRRGFELREPRPVTRLHQRADTCVGFDLDLNDGALHSAIGKSNT